MKTGSQRQLILLAPQALIVVGIILILSSLLDYTILLIPPNLLDRQWQFAFITQFVDRGIIPLVGLTLLFAGLWASNQVNDRGAGNFFKGPIALPALILSSLLGLIFLLVSPLHINNTWQNRTETLAKINEDATNANAQIESQINAQMEQERNNISLLLRSPDQLQSAIQSGNIEQSQAVLLQQFQSDPNSLEAYLKEQGEKAKTAAAQSIQQRRQAAEEQAKGQDFIAGIRTAINSLLFATGYIIIGWTGLREWKQ